MLQRKPLCAAIALGCSFLVSSVLCFAQVQDVALKAAYIYNFALFTTWPEDVASTAHFDVCATPETPMWDSLEKLNGKKVEGRPWTLVDLAAAGPGQCRIVVLSGEGSLAGTEAGVSALVIDDGSVQGPSSAAIKLVNEQEHIRFDVDTRKASFSGLTFSSKLLRLARNVS
ncbi:YfiR family protein [Pigmentiphaga aceris]|uniref:YfiR family protein n=1 Tax=Pigmentiphaga aceris TaxID=1940612 RepID=A0A5C0AXH4_9BURK|nr:YfiR family protein [Pigmentiphaga aceris]QEI07139.1 YfiR family protein [Pigmentiphaga aceris]